MVVSVG